MSKRVEAVVRVVDAMVRSEKDRRILLEMFVASDW